MSTSTASLTESLQSIPLPKDPMHQRFADLILRGKAGSEAYREAGFKAKTKRAQETGASRMLRNAEVAAYITAVQALSAMGAVMDRQEAMEFLTRNVRTPVGDVDERSDLAQEVIRDEIGEETIRTKIKMPGKIDAIDRLAKMMGWYEPEVQKVQFEVIIGPNAEA